MSNKMDILLDIKVLVKKKLIFFSMISCKISWRNFTSIFHIFVTMMLIDYASTSHFSLAFLQEISPVNFLFLHEILNFTLKLFLYKQEMCVFIFTSTGICSLNIS